MIKSEALSESPANVESESDSFRGRLFTNLKLAMTRGYTATRKKSAALAADQCQ